MISQLALPDFALQDSPQWCSFSGQIDLKKDHLFKIDVELYFERIDWNQDWTLTQEEKFQAERFYQQADQKRYQVTRHAIRHLIGLCTATEPRQLIFKTQENGKPYVDGVSFNISHSGNCILIALSNHALGIDVEWISSTFDFQPVIEFCFDASERTKLQTSLDQRIMFYTLWTRKEAILKATGEGLVDDLLTINCLKQLHSRLNHNYKLISWAMGDYCIFSLATTKINTNFKFWNYSPQKTKS